jgi:DNA-binding transcriptional ArsR family regulator
MSDDRGGMRGVLDIDRLVHEPARLLILSVLAGAEDVEFKFVETATGLTKGNLSSHATKLEEAGYLKVTKKFRDRTPVTSFRITAAGRAAFEAYCAQLSSALAAVKRARK